LNEVFVHTPRIKRLKRKGLVAGNGYSLTKISNVGYKPLNLPFELFISKGNNFTRCHDVE